MSVKQVGNRGTWKKGQSGNPKGRPPLGNSLAEAIRHVVISERLLEIVEKAYAEAALPHNNPAARANAREWIAKYGWPDERKTGVTTTATTDGQKTTIVNEIILPDA